MPKSNDLRLIPSVFPMIANNMKGENSPERDHRGKWVGDRIG